MPGKELQIGDKVRWVTLRLTKNRYGGCYEKRILHTGRITGNGFTENNKDVKDDNYPFTVHILDVNMLEKIN